MPAFNHPYFGLLDSDAIEDDVDVLWESEADVAGRSVEIQIWARQGAEADAAELDQFAERLQNLAELDRRARAALVRYLQDDGEYISLHREEMEGGDALPAEPAVFADAMTLYGIALWHQDPFGEGDALVLDYMIDPERSDQILAVSCTAAGDITGVNWES